MGAWRSTVGSPSTRSPLILTPDLGAIQAGYPVPLGPTGILFTGLEGGITFGAVEIPDGAEPDQLLGNPVLFSPLDMSLETVRLTVELALQEQRAIWDTGFVLSLRGNFTTVATPGILTGQLTLGVNIGYGGGNGSVKLFGTGSVDIWGIPLGEAAALLNLTNPLNPSLDFAAALPSPRNPLGFLFPAEGTFSIRVPTTGIAEAPVLALGIFIDEGSAGVLGVAQGAYAQILDRFAADLRAVRGPMVTQLFRDTNGDGVLSESEASRTIDRTFVVSRLLGDAAQGLAPILDRKSVV